MVPFSFAGEELALIGPRALYWPRERALLVAEQTTDLHATLETFSRIVPLGDHERTRIEREVPRTPLAER